MFDLDVAIVLSHATYVGASGATAAATYRFPTKDYQPPVQERYIDSDIVKNQNGAFKYLYDNGPGFNKWQPFKIRCEQAFASVLGATAGAQLAHLVEMWQHPGVLTLQAPEGTYTVHWAAELERSFRIFPKRSTDQKEYEVIVHFEEGQ